MQKALWVAESSDNSFFIVVGMAENSSGYSDAYIGKLKASDGSVIWEMRYSPTVSGKNNVAETVVFNSAGDIIIGGSKNTETPINEMNFKSSGLVEGGTPFIAKISAANVNGSSAPLGFTWIYDNT